MSVTLEEITKRNWEDCVRLQVRNGQEHFVASNVYSIVQSKYEPDKVPLAIYHEQTMVGFLTPIERSPLPLQGGDEFR
ncbi:MAG: spermidine acetyltransferase [Paenibacillus sp.]|nr:spermidine acetyltransferase [Paenibacillus sp.]